MIIVGGKVIRTLGRKKTINILFLSPHKSSNSANCRRQRALYMGKLFCRAGLVCSPRLLVGLFCFHNRLLLGDFQPMPKAMQRFVTVTGD